jgi:hypothetical protein
VQHHAIETRIERQPSVEVASMLLSEYAASLEFTLEFQDFEGELARLPGDYAPPGGALFLATTGGRPAGCVALRRDTPGTCELKRL